MINGLWLLKQNGDLILSLHFFRSLGSLKALRLWVDETGEMYRQSWFCNRIIIKDLQTDENFHFDVDNWFGTLNGDGEVFIY